ncbi:hypothetical protein WDU94_002548 [Cyamophila willieti]
MIRLLLETCSQLSPCLKTHALWPQLNQNTLICMRELRPNMPELRLKEKRPILTMKKTTDYMRATDSRIVP